MSEVSAEGEKGCEPLLMVEDVAEWLRVTPGTVLYLIRERGLAAIRINEGKSARWRIQRSDVQSFIDANRTQVSASCRQQ